MSAAPVGGGSSPGGLLHREGSNLLLRKLSLLSKAREAVEQNPADLKAECNLLCYGPDVYRIHSLVFKGGEDRVLPLRRWRREPCEQTGVEKAGDGEERETMDNLVALPTRMTFMSLLIAELHKSSTPLLEPVVEKAAKRKFPLKKRRKEAPGRADVEDSDDEGGEGGAQSGDVRCSVKCLEEERAMLRAIREPLATGRGALIVGRAGCVSEMGANAVVKKGDSNGSTGNRIAWEVMLDSLMNRDSAVDGNDEAVRSYLRRVAWIEQQKKLQPAQGGPSGSVHCGEQQSWLSLTEAMRVQKEMLRTRVQRKRFRRPHKETNK